MGRRSFGNFLRDSICAAIPRPSVAIPEQYLPRVLTLEDQDQIDQIKISNQILLPEKELNLQNPQEIPSSLIRTNKNSPQNSTIIRTQRRFDNGPRDPTPDFGRDRLYYRLRNLFDCGDTYAECTTNDQCNELEICVGSDLTPYGGYCHPSALHCSNTGCGINQSCDHQTGQCETELKECETDDDCGINTICREISEGKFCLSEDGFCESDVDCAGYKDEEGFKNKCDVRAKECVECIPNFPHVCGLPEFGKREDFPTCDPLGTSCFPQCNTFLSDLEIIETCCAFSHLQLFTPTCCDEFGSQQGDSLENDLNGQTSTGNKRRKTKMELCTAQTPTSHLLYPNPWADGSILERACIGSLNEQDKIQEIDLLLDSVGVPEYYRCQLNEANNWGSDNPRLCTQAWGGRGSGDNDPNNTDFMDSQCPPHRPKCDFNGICKS